jgi:hypothetical protein
LIYLMTIWNILRTFWDILWPFGIFYDHLVHFVFIWYIFPVLVSFTKTNLATLIGARGNPRSKTGDVATIFFSFFAQFWQKIAQNGSLLNKNFLPL